MDGVFVGLTLGMAVNDVVMFLYTEDAIKMFLSKGVRLILDGRVLHNLKKVLPYLAPAQLQVKSSNQSKCIAIRAEYSWESRLI